MYLCLVLMMYTSSTAQSSFKNYVQTKTYLDNAGTTFLRHIDYYDELGYVAETVDVGSNTSQIPLVVKLDYSPQMTLYSQWAPVPATGLDYLDDVSYLARTTYNDTEAYSDYDYDDFKELASSKKPGVAWEGHIATITRNAVPAGAVRKYSVASNGNLHDDGMYPSGLLTSTTTTDEDGRSMTVYVNMHGNTILERRASDNDTYYVYDGYGRLKYVLPPMCQQCSTSQMSKYWYKYTYDNRGRCTEKQLPGCSAVRYWYDEADRIESEQDGYLRSQTQSLYRNYSYDAIGRLLLQTISATRGEATSGNALKVEAKNYYDDYSFRQEVAQLFPEWADSINAVYASPMVARGRLTATLRYTSKTIGYFEMYRYDLNGRMTYKLSAYDDKWMKIVHTAYNFVGDVVTEEESVYTYSNTHISFLAGRRTVNTYHTGTRLLANTVVTHIDKNNNTNTQTVSNPTYDVFGNVIADNRPGTAADMTYTYDTLHGWLAGVSSPSGFSEQLQRETATNTQYSGNIGRMLWRNTANGEQHRYDYTYDSLGRLTSSQYSSSANGTADRYNESVTYNPNGSITTLLRNGMKNDGTFGPIDDLTVTYDGNRLLKVTDDAETLNYNGALDFDDGDDSTNEYHYDGNGALTSDSNRGINNITYDYTHYPSVIARVTKKKTVYNDYTPDGRKLSCRHVSYFPIGYGNYYRISIIDKYIDGLILRNDTTLLWRFNGGYVELNANGTPTSWNYYITDHLGSTRMVVGSDNSIKETINYYPFGSEMKMEDPALLTDGTSHPYRFTGKELDKLNNLNMYDFGARWYDVAGVPMWTSVDPLAEKYYNVSPYAYCAGNPVMLVDPEGKEPTDDEAARIAAHVYGDKEDDILTGGWRVSSRTFGISNEGGLKSQVYEKVNDNGDVTEYVYATAGTEPNDIDDWMADAAQVVGLSNQYHLSAVNARKISSQLGNEELNFVGHSLGGGEAALNSLLTFGDGKGRNAFTFNAAGVSVATKVREGGWKLAFKSEKSINAYITITDPLNNIQNRSMLLPSVNGNRKYVLPNRINGHSIYNFY